MTAPGWLSRHGFALLMLLLVGVLASFGLPRGAAIESMPAPTARPVAAPVPPPAAPVDPQGDPEGHARQARQAELRRRFDQASVMLHARQYEHAATALDRVLQLAPRLPEAHVNLGFAMLGLQRADAAAAAFRQAIELRPAQANAYYGLAMALEAGGDLPTALGAMRSYLHLSRADDPHRSRARAALWEWEQRLGRSPSPTGR